MFDRADTAAKRTRGFLATLVRDVRANALVIMTVALIPLAGMVGGGVDVSRMYILKTRLQHACDAGALAGRKSMGGGTWGYNNNYPRAQAEKFFDGNFEWDSSAKTGMFGSSAVSRVFTENAGRVSGAAQATIPMTLMRIFGRTTEVISVKCDADMRLPNTDVMFVLDVTGSMASKAVASDPDTKIDSLKTAVRCFYEIVARLDTVANCSTGTPSGGTGTQVQIRFGFMPYSTNVNVGRLLPPAYFADSWSYQSREPEFDGGQWVQSGTPAVQNEAASYPNVPQSYCTQQMANSLATHDEVVNGNSKQVTDVTYKAERWNNNTCYGTKTTTKTTYTWQKGTSFVRWHYGKIDTDVSGLKNGNQWKNNYQFTLPIGPSGTPRTITWSGCIEERQTVAASSYTPIPAGANDLNIDMIPTQDDATTLWGPALQQVIYGRAITTQWSQLNTADAYTTDEYYNGMPAYCPAEAKQLQQWPTASDFDTYVSSLQPTGNTYHDIGMLWGARFMSPTGMFKADNEFTPQGGEIERHMIFMTDGDAVSAPCDYTAYGVAFFDKRTTTDVGTASNCPNARGALNDQVNNRFAALCEAVKNKNITLWVISFGDGSNETTEDRLENCASPTRFFTARDSAALQQTFKSIADQISQLRLTK